MVFGAGRRSGATEGDLSRFPEALLRHQDRFGQEQVPAQLVLGRALEEARSFEITLAAEDAS
jgi:hypothetical protein